MEIPAIFSASIPLSDVLSYPVYRLVISAVCIVLVVALYYLIQRTRLGMMIRAGNHDRTMVEALGININVIYRFVFASKAPDTEPMPPITTITKEMIST